MTVARPASMIVTEPECRFIRNLSIGLAVTSALIFAAVLA